jgi:hypothetical protein
MEDLNGSFKNRMSKFRSLKKMKDALPKTPIKRAAVISSYFTGKDAQKSPTVTTLKKMNIVTSQEQKDMVDIGNSLLGDIKSALDHCKTQRNDDARKTLSVISFVVSWGKLKTMDFDQKLHGNWEFLRRH